MDMTSGDSPKLDLLDSHSPLIAHLPSFLFNDACTLSVLIHGRRRPLLHIN